MLLKIVLLQLIIADVYIYNYYVPKVVVSALHKWSFINVLTVLGSYVLIL